MLVEKRFELLTLLFLLVYIVMTAGNSDLRVETHVNENINSLFDALYWAPGDHLYSRLRATSLR